MSTQKGLLQVRVQKRIGLFCLRLSAILIAAGVLLWLPDPTHGELLPYKNAFVCFVTVAQLGKLLYDTLFFDRFYG